MLLVLQFNLNWMMGILVGFVFAAALQPRVFVGHSIYKGKAALTVEPKAPEFTPLDVCLIVV